MPLLGKEGLNSSPSSFGKGDKSMSSVLVNKMENVWTIIMDNPKNMNSLEKSLRDGILQALDAFSLDSEASVAVLTGSGKAFCAGGSLKELAEGMDAVEAVSYMNDVSQIIRVITGIEKPVIASVNGAAVGAGFNIALACDMIVASSNAIFSQAFAKVGLVPDLGGLYFLPRVVGMHKAKELIYTAKVISADDALKMGILNHVVPPEELEAFSANFAAQIAEGPPRAFGYMKTIMSRSFELSLEDMLRYENFAQSICIQSCDHKEGIKSFYEKRKPIFVGK
jgi:2-(1,2-epoxy-1,2-dihydrophenyl)acetyl-CoA isomerase